jgi:hypothetical protein
MFIGKATSVAAAPEASKVARSSAKTSGGKQRRIIPIGKLILPLGGTSERVLLNAEFPPEVGKTIRWVERPEGVVPRVGRVGPLPGRGITIGCVVAT